MLNAKEELAAERYVDLTIGTLSGEGSGQVANTHREQVQQITPRAWEHTPTVVENDPTYYDRPVLKQSVWSIDIPLYYFFGGAAGAALTLGAAVQLACRRDDECRGDLRKFAEYCHWTGIIGSSVGAMFLVHDLGRPSRFLHMVRVFRPSSPMNMGSWILGGAAPTAIATGLFINRGGFLGDVGEITGYLSGIFGTALAGYTGVLVSNSVIPVWQEARRWMPILFAASGMTTAASVIDIFYENERANLITYTFGNVGRVLELVASYKVEETASKTPRVGEPFHKPGTGTLWKAAGILTAASLLLSVLPGKSSAKRRVAGVLGAAGSLCLRFAVHYISNASARDARATFQVQRRQLKEARDGA